MENTQRIFQFRAWTGKEMINDIRLESAHGIRLVSPNDLAPHDMSDDKVILEQFTGLLDKNGKEIWEGDIVTTPYQRRAKVVWLESDSCFATETLDPIVRGEYQYSLKDIIAVIGNVHENPDLLSVVEAESTSQEK